MSEKIDLKGFDVTIGFPCGANIPWQTTMSLLGAVRAATKAGVDVRIQTIAGNSDVCDARNAVQSLFLATGSQHLFWIDSDIEFRAADFLKMLGHAKHYDVVVGAYPLKREDRALVINQLPGDTWEMNRHGLVKIASLGLGFTIVRRTVVEKWAAGRPTRFHPTTKTNQIHAFSQSAAGGEDITFFNEIRALGYDVWLDPAIELGHVGPFVHKADVVAALGLSQYYTPKE